jgi:hypothetical protein
MLCSTHNIFWVQEISGELTTINYYFSEFLNDSFCTDSTLVVRIVHMHACMQKVKTCAYIFTHTQTVCSVQVINKTDFWVGGKRMFLSQIYGRKKYQGFESSIFSTVLWCLFNVLHQRANNSKSKNELTLSAL